MIFKLAGVALGAALLFFSSNGSAQETTETAAGNIFQLEEIGSGDVPIAQEAKSSDVEMPGAAVRDSGPVLAPDFINFGYLQSNAVLPYLHYESLTHIATTFVDFDIDGNLINPGAVTDRSSYLKAGGAADRAGTKVIACVRNAGFSEAILNSVMQDAGKRANLVSTVRNLVLSDPYIQGVNFDFEFSWGTATRDGITPFIQAMRSALPSHEISIYVHASYNPNLWNMPALMGSLDYVLYSTYDWGTGNAVHATADFDSCLPHIRTYLNNGVPANKLVLTWAAYGRRWTGASGYNQNNGGAGKQSQGFYDGLYNTTLKQGVPYTSNYVRGDEIGWYTYNEGGTNYSTVHETPESLEYKISAALNFPGYNGEHAGVKLRGVGWWSLMWMSNYFNGGIGNFFDSYNPVTNSIVDRPPYYRHMNLLAQEILKAPGQSQFNLESFESGNDHWRDPNESPDTIASSASTFTFATAPAGINRPAGTVNAGRLFYSFTGSGNRAFVRYEMLNHPVETNVTDTNAALARVSKNTRVSGHYYVPVNSSTRNLRLALVDGARQMEVSEPIPLSSQPGWHPFSWDFNDTTQVNAWNTNEPALLDGNGVVNTAGPDARDISFLGFLIDGGGFGSGDIYFDELTYEDRSPDNKAYVINEFRSNSNSAEFVEIAGAPGAFPADLQLISYNPIDGSVLKSTALGGLTMPASGLFVIGDNGVPGAINPTGFKPAGWSSTDDVPDTFPASLQLYGGTSGFVYDSVVYNAYGGIKDFARVQTRRVAREGSAWLGFTGSGFAGNGQPNSIGRMADGEDSNRNQADFSLMPPSPGNPNGAPGILDTTFTFSTVPSNLFQTFNSPTVVNPPAASPSGGTALRVADVSGGVVAYAGDTGMDNGRGLEVTGQLYIPSAGHAAQAVAVGIGGKHSTAFFSGTPTTTGYDDGYWLIYEHGTVNLADGQSNHPGSFELVHATNDNQDSIISQALGTRRTLAATGAAANGWVNFRLVLNPNALPNEQLVAQINNIDVYRGSIPAGGPTGGPVAIGHRKAAGSTVATDGTFVHNLLITFASPPASVIDYQLY